MRKFVVCALMLGLILSVAPTSLAQEDCVISFLTVWSGEDELPNWEGMVAPFVEETGCRIEVESTRDLVPVLTTRVEAGNPPDIAGVPSFGAISTFLTEGDVVPLDFLDMDRMNEQFGEVWINLGTVDGTLYGIFPRAALKSLIWYSPKAFDAAGYTVPETWDDLLALCQQIYDDGAACFSIGLESQAASGWPATDWIEDIMLRTAPLEAYDAWISHDIEWTGEEVTRAWETFGEIAGNEDYLFGGAAGTVATPFGEAICPLFTDPPGAYLHRQASFIQSFIASCPGGEALVPGEDFDFFLFPPIDEQYGSPGLGGADLFVMFNDNENARALMEFLTQPEAMVGWLESGGSGIATNNQFPLDAYPDPLSRRAGELLLEVDSFRFDASDQMPGDVNQAFWTGSLNFVQNPDSLADILAEIEAIADEAYQATQ
ncbi:MAG: ABC transporter substrate-binding protein [Chloroflexota bacterium]|jgi:alpha-glucoside transport system substrate-binding protein|nr:ABC transporter substrate-binding protein [Anaerolineae bacterium]HMM27988.1 ABC transporter substrate-binding protein [Aggregatilineaceae bacterium]